jgi:transcription antitermination factor NusG
VTVPDQWFAAYTFSCQEKRVAQHLSTRAIEYFLPVSRAVRRWKNGCTILCEQPLFPSYLFVKIPRAHRLRVLELPGVHSLVGSGKEPIALPDAEIETLRQGLDLLNPEPCPYLNIGDKAKIIRGPLLGMAGIIVHKKNGLRLVLSLDLILKSVSVEVGAQDLEPIHPSGVRGISIASRSTSNISSDFADVEYCSK